MEEHSLQSPAASRFSAQQSARLRGMFGLDTVFSTLPGGLGLAPGHHFMLSGHVAFPKQNSRVLPRSTEILARLGEGLLFLELGNPANGKRAS